ncbi:MAG: HEPN domain-containing protein [Deltaproteobacteria bacterium]|nr:HEPN domain-containing protein [Deltaproteobacteria bacterium]
MQNRVLAIVPDARIILYGSRARGDAGEDSDWDFLVLLEKDQLSAESKILRAIYEFELSSRLSISVFVTTKDIAHRYQLTPFYQFIGREGIDLTSSDSRVEEPDEAPVYSLEELVRLRFRKADQAFHEARFSFDQKSYALALNRLYYAAFYALTALFMKEGVHAKTHQGVKKLFHQYLVLSGRVSKDSGILYNELFDKRMKGDYSLIYEPLKEEVESFIPKVNAFLEEIRGLIGVTGD